MKKMLVVIVTIVMVMLSFTMVFGTASAEKKDGKADHVYVDETYKDQYGNTQTTVKEGEEETGAWGKMMFQIWDGKFKFVFNGHGLDPKRNYQLRAQGQFIAKGTTNKAGEIHIQGTVLIKIWSPYEVYLNLRRDPEPDSQDDYGGLILRSNWEWK